MVRFSDIPSLDGAYRRFERSREHFENVKSQIDNYEQDESPRV